MRHSPRVALGILGLALLGSGCGAPAREANAPTPTHETVNRLSSRGGSTPELAHDVGTAERAGREPRARARCHDSTGSPPNHVLSDRSPEADDDVDRIPNALDACPDQPETYNGMDDEDGCPDRGAPCLPPDPLDPVRDVLGPLLFERGEVTLDPSAQDRVRRIVEALNLHPSVLLIEVQGHADPGSEHTDAVELAQRRAQGVAARLLAEGLDPSRVRVRAYADFCPAAPPDAPVRLRRHNRAVRIMIAALEGESPIPRDQLVCPAALDL